MLTRRPSRHVFTLIVVCIVAGVVFLSTCAKKPVVIRVWQTETDPSTLKVLEGIAARFEESHKGVKVEIDGIAWGALATRLLTAINAGNPPDIAHLQPFMVQSLYRKQQLAPIDDVIESIGKDDIYPRIRQLQHFEGHYYGIAHAFNTAQWGYRKDLFETIGQPLPISWSEYLEVAKRLTTDDRFGVMLPGGDPLFIEFLLAQFVACNGGRLYEPTGRPAYTERPVLDALEFFGSLSENCPPEWISTKYLDQFRLAINGQVALVPFTGVRASKQYENDAPANMNDPEHFAVMEPPIGPRGSVHYGSYDGEPFVIFKNSKNTQLAKEFLIFFYQRDNYLEYCKTVPVHLSPIFQSLNESPDYEGIEFVQKWKPWRDLIALQIQEERVLPFLIAADHELKLPFLLEIQSARILSDMVYDVTTGKSTPLEAAKRAKNLAEMKIAELGYKTW